MVESSLVLYGGEIIAASRGGPASVEFDFESVWQYRKRQMRDVPMFSFNRLEWIHVHPTSFGIKPSTQDQLCAESLCRAFGINELPNFTIISFSSENLNSIEGKYASYRYTGKWFETELMGHLTDGVFTERLAYILRGLSMENRNAD